MKRIVIPSLVLALAFGTVCALGSDKKATKNAEKDYWAGTWVLVPGKSTYKGQPGPKSARLVIQKAGIWEYTSVGADGKELAMKSAGDGTIVIGTNKLTVTTKQVDSRTVEHQYTVDGQVVWATRGVVAPNGKTFTMTGKGINQKGEARESTEVYKKQK